MKKLLLLLGAITLIVLPATVQAALAKLALSSVSAYEANTSGTNKYAVVNWELSRAVDASEKNLYLIVKDSAGKTTITSAGPLKQNVKGSGSSNTGSAKGTALTVSKGALDSKYVVQLVDKSNNKTTVLGSQGVTVKPFSSVDPSSTLASGTNCYRFVNTLFQKANESQGICASDFLGRAYAWAVGLAIVGASIMIIYAGYRYTLSRGNPGEINNAKEIIYSVLVGLALLLLSYTILNFLGVRLIKPATQTNTSTGATGANSGATTGAQNGGAAGTTVR